MMRWRWLWIFLLTTHAQAQAPVVRNLVFEGAGIRGIAYAGAIQVLEEKDMLKQVERVGGTSAGAITALLLSLGYNAGEIGEIVGSTKFKKFNDGRFFFIGGISRMKKYYGWYRGREFEKWLDDLIVAKTGNAQISFAELKAQGFKDLYVTGTSLNRQRTMIFSYEHFPQMKVRDAVHISMSIPYYFEAVFLDSTGRVVKHPKEKAHLDVMVDGGFTANFPLFLFDSSKYMGGEGPNVFLKNMETIGFRIDRKKQIEYDSLGKGLAPLPIEKFRDFNKAFYFMLIENLNRQLLTEEDWLRTVSIDDADVLPRIKKLPSSQLNALLNNGSLATRRFLEPPRHQDTKTH